MTTTVSLDRLRELAGFRARNGCAISLYLDLDPSTTPTAADTATRVNSLLDAASKSHGATRGDLAHEVREGLKGDFERVGRYFEAEFDRDGSRGLALFAAGLDNVWSVLPLPWSVPDQARVANDFLLAPLVPLLGRGQGALVALVNREQGRVFALRNGRLEEIADRTKEAPSKHDQGGWSQSRFQRHIENVAHEHYKSVADELELQFRRLERPRIVIVCTDEVRPEVTQALSTEVEEAVIGWASAEQHAGAAVLLDATLPIIEEWRARNQTELVGRWREATGRNSRGVAGWADTLEAASDGRVETLLYAAGVSRDAFWCPACGRASAQAVTCPLDGTTMEPRDDGLDLAVRLTLSHGGEVCAIEFSRDLDPVEGIGAVLRF